MPGDYYICFQGHITHDLEDPTWCAYPISFDQMTCCWARLRKMTDHEVAAWKLGGPTAVAYDPEWLLYEAPKRR